MVGESPLADVPQQFNVPLSMCRERKCLSRFAHFNEDQLGLLTGYVTWFFEQPFRREGKLVDELCSNHQTGFEIEAFDPFTKRCVVFN